MVARRGTNIFTENSIFTRGLLHIDVPMILRGGIDFLFDPEEQINPAKRSFFSHNKGLQEENPIQLRASIQPSEEDRETRSMKCLFVQCAWSEWIFNQAAR
jgi:hypothetical protein